MFTKRAFSVLFVVFSFSHLYSEPSAFELQSGATKDDISSLQLYTKILQGVTTDLQSRLLSLEQSQSGFQSLLEGQNLKIKSFTDSFYSLQQSFNELNASSLVLSNRIDEASQVMNEFKARLDAQQEDLKKFQTQIQDIKQAMTESNNSIIQQLTLISQYLENSQRISPNEEKDTSGSKANSPNISESSKSDAEIFVDAKELIKKKEFDSAKTLLDQLTQGDYKIAEVYFMLGDIAFGKKQYGDAIEFYRKSTVIDDKATYMPVLLWRTAWSFKYLKDEDNYKRFIDLIVALYPDSEQARRIQDSRKSEAASPSA